MKKPIPSPKTRCQPYSIEAEQALLGAMFVSQDVIPKAQAILDSHDFYKEAHQNIVEAFFELKSKADPVTVTGWLTEHGRKVPDGYVGSLVDCVFTSAGWAHHAEIIKALSERRKLIGACQEGMDRACNLTENFQTVLSEHKHRIRIIGEEKTRKTPTNRELADQCFTDIEIQSKGGELKLGPLAGLENIDKHLHGFRRGTVSVLGAESGIGKSAFAGSIGDHIALNSSGLVPYYTLESTSKLLMFRRLAMHSGIPLTRLNLGIIHNEYEWERLTQALNIISADENLMFLDDPQFSILEKLIAHCESLAMETPLSFVIIDYLQLMESLNKQNTRHHEISHISREISRLAKRLDVPILLISQLGKDIEKRPKRRPRLSDLKESGDIRNDAHNVIFIYRESEETSRTEILCSKGKDMGTWADHVEFNRFIMKFSDCEEPYQPEREEDFDL